MTPGDAAGRDGPPPPEPWVVVLVSVCVALLAVGLDLTGRGLRAIHRQDRLIESLKRSHPRLSEWIT